MNEVSTAPIQCNRIGHVDAIAFVLMSLCGACSRAPENEHASLSASAVLSVALAANSNQSSASILAIASDSAEVDSAPKRYKGSFKARKLKVLPQSTAEDDAWKRDDGKFGSGAGEIEIEIGAHGLVTGEAHGPWGTLDVNGELSQDVITATLSAHDNDNDNDNGANAHGVFNGVLTARIIDGAIDAKMRVSSGDAVIARDADSHLALDSAH